VAAGVRGRLAARGVEHHASTGPARPPGCASRKCATKALEEGWIDRLTEAAQIAGSDEDLDLHGEPGSDEAMAERRGGV